MDDQVELEIKEFTCPNCGSHHFEQRRDDGGICHGYRNGQPCDFRFAFDDPRFFKGTGRFYPRTVVGRSVR